MWNRRQRLDRQPGKRTARLAAAGRPAAVDEEPAEELRELPGRLLTMPAPAPRDGHTGLRWTAPHSPASETLCALVPVFFSRYREHRGDVDRKAAPVIWMLRLVRMRLLSRDSAGSPHVTAARLSRLRRVRCRSWTARWHRPDRSLILPVAYVAEHVDLGYAISAHRAQGATVDMAHAIVHSSAMIHGTSYVAMPQGRRSSIAQPARPGGRPPRTPVSPGSTGPPGRLPPRRPAGTSPSSARAGSATCMPPSTRFELVYPTRGRWARTSTGRPSGSRTVSVH